MSALEEWMIPDIRDDGICDLCDEVAMAYDDNSEYGYCAEHAMVIWSGFSIEDFLIDANYLMLVQANRNLRIRIVDNGICTMDTNQCAGPAMPRMQFTKSDEISLVLNACTYHAMRITTNFPHLPNLGEWLEDIVL